ncbi:MAG: hypothetical protein JW703_03315, partial [Candidatus Diapherotrites archaeon]|nr:hypothetical protein [Candidatus Diapherotrites archaeon]
SLGIMPFVYDYLFVLSLKEKENTDKIKFFKMIVKDELINAEPEEKDFYIVYSDKFQLKNIIPLLEKINEKFIVFGLKGNAKNIEFHEKYSNEFFSEKLIECKGILSHGGMSLISEAIQLKKPVYTFTSAKFFERFYNGAVNEELGFGLVEETPSLKKLNEFFSRINEFKKNIEKSGIKAENNKILKEINKLIEK